MRLCLTTFIFSTALASSVLAGIDFTPTPGERVQEGVVFKQLVFHQDGHAVTYEQPRG